MADRERGRRAASRARSAAGERIAIFGDYDVDGTTSAAILAGILERLGGERRARCSRTASTAATACATRRSTRVLATAPRVLVTCDCGSSDHARVERARARGRRRDRGRSPPRAAPSRCPRWRSSTRTAPIAASPTRGCAARGSRCRSARRCARELGRRARPARVPRPGGARHDRRRGAARRRQPPARARRARAAGVAGRARPGIVALREAGQDRARRATLGAHRRRVPPGAAPERRRPARRSDAHAGAAARARRARGARARGADRAAQRAAQGDRGASVTAQAMAQVLDDLRRARPRAAIVAAGEGWHRGVRRHQRGAARATASACPRVVIGVRGRRRPRQRARAGRLPAVRRDPEVRAEPAALRRPPGRVRPEPARRAQLEAFRADFARAQDRRPSARRLPSSTWTWCSARTAIALPPASDLLRLEPLGEANAEPLFLLSGARVESSAVVGQGPSQAAARGRRRAALGVRPRPGCAPARGRAARSPRSARCGPTRGWAASDSSCASRTSIPVEAAYAAGAVAKGRATLPRHRRCGGLRSSRATLRDTATCTDGSRRRLPP